MSRASQALALDSAKAPVDRADEALVEGCLSGDPQALHRLYHEYAPSVRRVICLLGPTATSVDDLVHDVFVRALEILPRYRGEASIDVWLRGIALNLTRTQLAKAHRRRRLLGRLGASVAPEPAPALDSRVHGRRALERLRGLLDQLPPAEREAFVLRRIERLSVDEVAAITRTPSSTTSDRAQRAERKLRAWMEGNER